LVYTPTPLVWLAFKRLKDLSNHKTSEMFWVSMAAKAKGHNKRKHNLSSVLAPKRAEKRKKKNTRNRSMVPVSHFF